MDDITAPSPSRPVTNGSDDRVSVRVRYWAGAAEAADTPDEVLLVPCSPPATIARRAEGDVPGRNAGAAPEEGDDSLTVTVAQVRASIVVAHPGIDDVLRRCSVLVAGRRCDDDARVNAGEELELLPPFAGG